MASERWRQIEQLYHLALEQNADSRSAFVAQACGGDEALRREVESLLAAAEGDDAYLETPAVAVAAKSLAQAEARWNLAGKTVSHYLVVEKLGRAREAPVYRAEDSRLGRPVALEFLPRLAGDPQAMERFQREARAASILNHPNICTVYDIDQFEGAPFIAMEFLEGQTLDLRLAGKALAVDELLDLALQIADGLDAAHQRGLLHRDLKPLNLFITTRGQAKILNFGLASLHAETPIRTEPASPLLDLAPGAAACLSPEQLRGENLDARTDLFSLGAVLYEMATGVRAFDGNSNADICDAVLHRAPSPVSQLNPSLPPKLDDVIGKALEKDREVRYQHAADLRADLKRVKREMDSLRIARTAQPSQPAHLGRYQITGRLGAGGMGTVYEGTDPVIGRTVAIKTILQDRLGSSQGAVELRARLMREARAAGSLAHPNIVTVFDAGEEPGVTYIVMELIRGSTLDAMLPCAGTPVPTQRALEILAEAATALDFAHSRGVVHRDVKPSNIMIQADGIVKLTDFGIARSVTDTVTLAGSLAGTPYFMSPEQLRGEEATRRSDQYSLAVVAWILLTGSRPFDGDQLMPLISKILTHEPPRSGSLNPPADGVLRRALAKDAEARFESCSSFMSALRAACIQKPAANLETGRTKRRRILAAAVLACLLAAAGIAWRLRPQPVRHEQKASAISPDPIASPPAMDTPPKANPPDRQAAAASGERSSAKAAPIAAPVPARVSPPSRAAGTAPSHAGVLPQPSGPYESKTNPRDGLTYIWIPAGTFQMGCSPEDNECFENEKPAHQVTITKGFRMGQTEVTQEAYQKVIGRNPSFFRGVNRPVDNVTWDEARSYCQAIGMRLPTEAEWEYAARAGSTGSRYGELDRIAWVDGNSEKQTHQVAGKQANAWGLHDMLGNVWEWVADWFARYPPGDATDPEGPATGQFRALRGGAWLNKPRAARASGRSWYVPEHRGPGGGFRCAQGIDRRPPRQPVTHKGVSHDMN
ncbi:MAG TPA: bifunctional serine/threonine-protein kinase/formylglycine-generating enzyme family protein [Bryobacteraceae bacterium]|nr:bifunctional serine/threonine-protein kinase/formylglycine-generating enzyme family protein [Bryobacteraceae bacterium]